MKRDTQGGRHVWLGAPAIQMVAEIQAHLLEIRGATYTRPIVIAEAVTYYRDHVLRMAHGQSHKTDADTAE